MAKKVEPSNKSFGLFFAAVFGVGFACAIFYGGTNLIITTTAGLSLTFSGLAIYKPKILAPIKKLWLALGLALHKVTSPIILSIMFIIFIVPFAVLFRIFKRDALKIRPENQKQTWVEAEKKIYHTFFDNQY